MTLQAKKLYFLNYSSIILTIFIFSTTTSAMERSTLNVKPSEYYKYTKQYKNPHLFENNYNTYLAKMKLLDHIPRDGHIRIISSEFNNSKQTRAISTHLCFAAKRGVKVEFITDYKSISALNKNYNAKNKLNIKVVQELLQLITNCGVKVKIHNYISQKRLTTNSNNEFTMPKIPHYNISISSITGFQKFKNYVRYSFNRTQRKQRDLRQLLLDFQSVLNKVLVEMPSEQINTYKQISNTLQKYFKASVYSYYTNNKNKKLSSEELLKQIILFANTKNLVIVSKKELALYLNRLFKMIKNSPMLDEYFRNIILINAPYLVNQFIVSYEDRSCMFNDNTNLNYDVNKIFANTLICSNNINDSNMQISSAINTFNKFWSNKAYKSLNLTMKDYKINYGYKYKYLLFSDKPIKGWGIPFWLYEPIEYDKQGVKHKYKIDWQDSKYKKYENLSNSSRKIKAPKYWQKKYRVIKGKSIKKSYAWSTVTNSDLLQAIDKELYHIYIETNITLLDKKVKEKLITALKRNVKIYITTNNRTTTYSSSSPFALINSMWLFKIKDKYPKQVKVNYIDIERDLDINSFIATFECQKENNKSFQLNILGSNYNLTSFKSVKYSNYISWKITPEVKCNKRDSRSIVQNDISYLAQQRLGFYKKNHIKLTNYSTLEEEINNTSRYKILRFKSSKLNWLSKSIHKYNIENDEYKLIKDAENKPIYIKNQAFFTFMEVLGNSNFMLLHK